jgi:hypothetical protein
MIQHDFRRRTIVFESERLFVQPPDIADHSRETVPDPKTARTFAGVQNDLSDHHTQAPRP